jgi:lipopolysaccharide assembly protein A
VQMFLFSALVFSLLVAIFAIQNAVQVTVTFLFWNFQTSLVLVILSAAVIGALALLSVGVVRQFNLTRQIKEYEAKLKELDTKLLKQEEKVQEEAAKAEQVEQGP